jgi:phosphate-selective porin OprO/OprP
LNPVARAVLRRVLVVAVAWPTGTLDAQEPSTSAGFQDGFFVQSGCGDNRLGFGLVTQMDARFSLGDTLGTTNTFTIRKMRPTLTGRVARYFDFKVMPDFGNGTVLLTDAYFDTRLSTALRIRAGKDKTPVGYELLIGDAFLFFPERALASSLVPNRDVGVSAQGDLLGGKLFYAAGVFNGVPDGASSTSDVDTRGSKDLAGRVVVQPFWSARAPAGPLDGLGFQLGASRGNQTGALPSFRTSATQTYFSYASGMLAAGMRTRFTPTVFYYHGPFAGFAEHMTSTQRVGNGTDAFDVTNRAWEITGSFVLTGEAGTDRGVRPSANFDPSAGTWGALQSLARVTELRVDEGAFAEGLTAPGASRTARSWTVAFNWYPTAYIKYYVTFERTVFDGDPKGPRRAENLLLTRFQLGF